MTRCIPAALLLLVAGCSDPDNVVETGECFDSDTTDAAAELDHTVLSFASEDFWIVDDVATVITSADELTAFETEHEIVIAETVDFDSEQILVAGINVGSTCGTGAPSIRVLDIDGAAHLELEVTNPDGTCTEVCDMAAMELVAVSVTAGLDASACARLVETCE